MQTGMVLATLMLIAGSGPVQEQYAFGWTHPALTAARDAALGAETIRTCQRRAGPFATQSTAWQRRNGARAQGWQVSGVFPCYDGRFRGYCFNVFYGC